MPGPIGLLGSGEFTPATEAVDAALLEGRTQRVVFLPTAAAPEGKKTISYWVELGLGHYRRLGIDATPLMVLDRDDADNAELAAEVAGAGLVYLSGGDPAYLAATLTGSRVAAAIHEAWSSGTAVAGCSAGAIVLMDRVPDIHDRTGPSLQGLGLVPGMTVIPHFDQIEQWAPGVIQSAMETTPAGVALVGIEEETAVVGGPREWTVMGESSAWLLNGPGEPVGYAAGEVMLLR